MSTAKRSLVAVAALALLVCVVTTIGTQAAALTVTVTGVTDGNTEKWIGATEGDANFDINDLVACGLQNYRIWVSSAELEPNDDDGVYGSPTIAEIKADPDIIPWSVWETNFRSTAFRQHGVSLYDQLAALSDNGILPVTSLVNVNNGDMPVWMRELNPPDTTEDWNEWWEHVFAVVYYTNVVEGMEVHDWQVHNEPDNAGQGWDGTLADYIVFTQYTADAIHYVYDTFLPGKTARVYAPVSTHCNEWIEETLINNDDIVDVIDWHRYGPPYGEAVQVNTWINQYDSDGQHEDPFISEWGSYRGGYESHGSAMNYAGYVMDHSIDTAGYVGGSSIFPFYDWVGSRMTGLVLADGTRTATFYAFRLMIRAVGGGKTRYVITEEPPRVHNWVAAVDEGTNTMHVTLWSKGVKDDVVTIDVSAHVSSSTATLYRYAEGVNDEMVGTAPVTNGVVVVDLLASSVMEVAIPLAGGPGPTDTPVPPTDTPVPPTDTPVPPTDTPEPPTDTPEGPTDTPAPPTDTPVPPTDTPVPPTDTPAPPTDTPAPTDTPGGGGTIFFDGFEDGDFDGWTISGVGDAQIRNNPYEGTYNAGAKLSGWFSRTISTAGYTNVRVKYAGMTPGFEAGESLTVEWYDGSTWYLLDELNSETYILRDWDMPAGADDNAAFALRFTGVADKNVEWANADNVEVTGQ